MTTSTTLACNLDAITPSERERHLHVTTKQVFESATAVHELPDGYAFLFEDDPDLFGLLAAFVENERRCCAFVRFQIEVEPSGDRLWLRMTGDDGVKPLLESVLDDVDEAVRTRIVHATADETRPAASALAGALRKAVPLKTADTGRTPKRLAVVAGALAALCCTLPLAGLALGIGTLSAAAVYFEQAALVSAVVAAGALGLWQLRRHRAGASTPSAAPDRAVTDPSLSHENPAGAGCGCSTPHASAT